MQIQKVNIVQPAADQQNLSLALLTDSQTVMIFTLASNWHQFGKSQMYSWQEFNLSIVWGRPEIPSVQTIVKST